MPTSPATQPTFTNKVFGAFVVLSVFGMVGLAVAAVVGFEEPNETLLLVSFVLMLAAPVAMLVHLTVTKELTWQEKRIWIRQLASHRGARVFSAYLTSHDRGATVENLAAEGTTTSRSRDEQP